MKGSHPKKRLHKALSRRQFLSLAGIAGTAMALPKLQSSTTLADIYPILNPQLAPSVLWNAEYLRYSDFVYLMNVSSPVIQSATSGWFLAPSQQAIALTKPDVGVSAIDVQTGAARWEGIADGRVVGIDDTHVYVRSVPKRIDSISLESGEVRWRFLLENYPNEVEFFPGAFGIEDIVYLPHGQVQAIGGQFGSGFSVVSSDSGSFLWDSIRFSNGPAHIQQRTAETLVVSNQNLLGGSPAVVYGLVLNAEVPTMKWSTTEGQSVAGISGDTLFLFEGQDERSLIAQDIDTGDVRWQTQPMSAGFSGSSYGDTNSNIYLGTRAGYNQSTLIALDFATGDIRWQSQEVFGSAGEWEFLGEHSGLTLVASPSFGLIRAYSANTFEAVWEYGASFSFDRRMKVIGVSADTIIIYQNWYVDRDLSTLFGLDINTGQQKWKREINTRGTWNFAPVISSNKLIYSGSGNETGIWILDCQTGQNVGGPLPLAEPSRAQFVGSPDQILFESALESLGGGFDPVKESARSLLTYVTLDTAVG